MSGQYRHEYENDGFVLIPSAISTCSLDKLEQQFLSLTRDFGAPKFDTARSPEFSEWLSGDRDIERKLYDDIRQPIWLDEFSTQPSIVEHVRALLDEEIGLLGKIVFRIDIPMVIRELAVWHQDHHYVKGNTHTVTAWIPLQDTFYETGCLLVMGQSLTFRR